MCGWFNGSTVIDTIRFQPDGADVPEPSSTLMLTGLMVAVLARTIHGPEQAAVRGVKPPSVEKLESAIDAHPCTRVPSPSQPEIGNLRTRLPVAAKIAFATEGATCGTACSPNPPGAALLFTI